MITIRHRWVWIAAGALLSVPAIAQQFSAEVNWTGMDFLVMGILLGFACALWELGVSVGKSWPYHLALTGLVGAGLLTTWVNLAVGILGSTFDIRNSLFFAVLVGGGLGALTCRGRTLPMARTLAWVGGAQLLVSVAIFVAQWEWQAGAFSTVLALGWLGCSSLFYKARETANLA